MMRTMLFAVWIVFAMSAATGNLHAGYIVKDLGILQGTLSSEALGLNASGLKPSV